MSGPRGNARFATTRWTLVAAAGQRSDGASDRALAELCQVYWPPLYGYLRGRGHKPEEAQDLTQGFFACLLERRGLRLADPARGRFRAFLLTALKRYVINEHEHAVAVRRGGGSIILPLDFEEAERTYARDRRNDDTPERAFDRKWATIALDRAVRRLRDEHRHADKRAIAERLLPYLTEAGGLPAYSEVAAQLGLTEPAVKVAVHRLRQRLGAILRLEVAETVATASDVDDEVRALIRAVSA
jgi:RNA polymerase sigma-70 factor (ECF subfamily)